MYKRSELFFNALLVPLDFLMVVTAFVAAYLIRTRLIEAPIAFYPGREAYLDLVLIVAPIWIFIFAVLGLYSFRSDRSRFQELGRVTVAVSAAVMVLIVWEYVTRETVFPSRSIPIYALGLGIPLVSLGRLGAWSVQRAFFRYGTGVHRVLLIGKHRNAEILAHELGSGSSHRIVGVLDDAAKQGSKIDGVEVIGRISDLEKVVSRHHVDEVIVTDPRLSEAVMFSLIAYCEAKRIIFRYIPTLFGIYNVNTAVSQIAGVPVIEPRKTSLDGWGRIQKRLFDIVASLIGLLVLTPPFALIAAAIKFDSKGSVFYRHERVGRDGRLFKVIKFRTMDPKLSSGDGRSDTQILKEHFKDRPELAAEFAENQKLKDDPRVTRVGRFLRRTSLDEFPQLWNVFRGEMTLVGPRPVTPAELDKYGVYRHMLLVLKPGVTGLWQVSGRSDVSYEERVRLDTYYIENWSLWLDIQTILRTFKVLLRRTGAY